MSRGVQKYSESKKVSFSTFKKLKTTLINDQNIAVSYSVHSREEKDDNRERERKRKATKNCLNIILYVRLLSFTFECRLTLSYVFVFLALFWFTPPISGVITSDQSELIVRQIRSQSERK